MSRSLVGGVQSGDRALPLSIHRSGRTLTFEVDGRPRYAVEARSSALARELETRFAWWLARDVFRSFDELHERVVVEYDRARACAARMQRGSVYRTEAHGATP